MCVGYVHAVPNSNSSGVLVEAGEKREWKVEEKGAPLFHPTSWKNIMVPPSRSICHKPAGFLEKTSDVKIGTSDV